MRVSEASEIIYGELINSPAIGSFEGFTTKVADVKRGTLFFASDIDDVNIALQNGAFGVVFDTPMQISNTEIAWIKVDNIQSSIVRLVRYLLVSKKIEIILLDEIQYAIAKAIIRTKDVLFFEESTKHSPSLQSVSWNANAISVGELLEGIIKQNPTKIMTSLKGIADLSIEEYTTCVNSQDLALDIITPHQIFESKFYHKVSAYQIPLPAVFMPELSAVIELCLREEIAFDLRDFPQIEHLLPIALSPEAEILPLGKSNKVVIPTHSTEIFLRYAKYLKENAKFGELVFFVPRILDESSKEVFTPVQEAQNATNANIHSNIYSMVEFCIQNRDKNGASSKETLQAICYDTSNELPKMLKLKRFNFALVLGIGTEGLIFVLNEASKDTSPVLF